MAEKSTTETQRVVRSENQTHAADAFFHSSPFTLHSSSHHSPFFQAIILKTRLAPGLASCFIRDARYRVFIPICPRPPISNHAALAMFMA
jgi:hypothetical protein